MSPYEPSGMPCEPKNCPKCLEVFRGFKSILRHCFSLIIWWNVSAVANPGIIPSPTPSEYYLFICKLVASSGAWYIEDLTNVWKICRICSIKTKVLTRVGMWKGFASKCSFCYEDKYKRHA